MNWKRDICKVDGEWLKGRLQEGVVDESGNVIAIFAEGSQNANLVAAAPELLEALKVLCTQMNNLLLICNPPARFADSFNAGQARAIAAIAKAKEGK